MIKFILLGFLGWVAFTILLYLACYTIGYALQMGKMVAVNNALKPKKK